MPISVEGSAKTSSVVTIIISLKLNQLNLVNSRRAHSSPGRTFVGQNILGCVFQGQKLSGRRFISLPVPTFCSLSRASRASPTWLKKERNDFYACFLRRYLHGPQSCFPSSERRCTLFRRSSGPYENLLLLQNGENITISIRVKCCR